MSARGRVYRRCACRGADGKQLGARCPRLAGDSRHGRWTFAVDVPSLDGRRKTMRRGGFPTRRAAQAELDKVNERTAVGVRVDDRQTVAGYLAGWLAEKSLTLKPTTLANYRRYVEQDLVPAVGVVRLERLHHDHVARLVADLSAAERGPVTVRRIVAVLSSALSDAVRQRRLTHNPARYVVLPPVERCERVPWTAAQTVAFLDRVRADPLGSLFELLVGCGLRRGEALALRWSDVDLDGRVLHVRRTLSEIGSRLVFTPPKTEGSAAGVGLSRRVVEALRVHHATQELQTPGEVPEDALVFTGPDGAPLRPGSVLRRFRALAKSAGLPEIRLHDLRHGAATLMIGEGVPLPIVSKVLRHARVSITADLYGHLVREVAIEAADTMGAALDAAAAERAAEAKLSSSVVVPAESGPATSVPRWSSPGGTSTRDDHPVVSRLGDHGALNNALAGNRESG